ncbi:hypothetical protein QR685DRAFT_514174 [Neurospora intermedia]|uniref:Secreted protein n=1 Tax=Neurospora intermedia TaxID=5142 RepID=A0ABR3DTJ7_NEUIN
MDNLLALVLYFVYIFTFRLPLFLLLLSLLHPSINKFTATLAYPRDVSLHFKGFGMGNGECLVCRGLKCISGSRSRMGSRCNGDTTARL